jgi:hypothetical protein
MTPAIWVASTSFTASAMAADTQDNAKPNERTRRSANAARATPPWARKPMSSPTPVIIRTMNAWRTVSATDLVDGA